MTEQLLLFDPPVFDDGEATQADCPPDDEREDESEDEKKERGIAVAAANNPEYLRQFRDIALELAESSHAPISIEDVRRVATERGIQFVSGNWMGGLFRGQRWEWTGTVKATHVGGHSRPVGLWRLVTGPAMDGGIGAPPVFPR